MKDYTQVSDVAGIVWDKEPGGTPILVSSLAQITFSEDVTKVTVVKKGGRNYLKLSS